MSNYGRAQGGGPWGEGWLSLFPPVCTDANDQERKLREWAVDTVARGSISLLLKSVHYREKVKMTLRSYIFPGSRRETTAIRAR